MALPSFIFDPTKGETPQTLARKRAISDAIMRGTRFGSAQNVGEGIGQLFTGIGVGLNNRRLNAAEQTGLAGANDLQTKFANWISGRNTFPDAPSSTSADATGDVASNRVAQAFGDSTQSAHASEHERDPSIAGLQIKGGIESTAKALGIDPVDLATAISYETGGTFDPTKTGPTTKWGQHRGFIQFGEPQAKQYGVDWSNPIASQLGPDGAVAKYLRDTGVKPGMGMLDIYSAINAGGVGRYGASDAAAGGAPGTVADKVNSQMAGHRAKALAMFGGGGQPAASAAPVQVASLDPSAGMPSAIPPVPEEYARTGLSQAAWERMNAPNGAVPPVQPAPTPGPANVPVTGGKGDRVSMAQTAAVSMQPGPIPNANPVQAAFIDRMTNPQSMTGGSPMPLQGMPQPAPKQVAQAEPDLSRVPVTAGGTAGARQAGDAPPVDMGLLMQVMSNPFVDENTKAFAANMIEQQMKSQDPSNQLDMEYRRAQIAKMQREAAGLGKDATVQSSVVLDDGTSVLVMNDGKRRVLGPTGDELSGQSAADAIRAARQYTVDNQRDIYSGRRAGTLNADIELGADAEAQKASGRASGKGEGEAQVAYKSMLSKMPGLEKVVGELSGLADEATYTTTGQWVDWGRKELGMEPRDAAVARTKYVSMVDNQILPLLRDTFGAQFTVQEGESLRATLGDPNKTPTEKKQVLEAFIEQKRRDVEALAVQAGGSPAAPSGDNWQDVGGVKIRRKQ